MEEIDGYRSKVSSGREIRLLKEWESLDLYLQYNKEISYIIRKRNPIGIPLVYDIIFNIKSITGVEDADERGLQEPIFNDRHILRISIPNNYPSVDGGYPDFKFTTDIWHPNIRFFGDFKGRVCLNFEDSGTFTALSEYIDKVADYLRYSDYHALNEYPYPEDQIVAQWVLEQAEPQGWLNFHEEVKRTPTAKKSGKEKITAKI
jgi:Ubiquitin-protein ligase